MTIEEQIEKLHDDLAWVEHYWKAKNKKLLLSHLDKFEEFLKELREDVETDPGFDR